ncbi:MAG: HD domain-containing protein [Clostridium sp.]|uniref:HD domain-containing protein n=1 Tax=Clostridium sp. TaxID=1506 RepID=UPI0029064CFF|nr:HD domain-containing protein [Clostridium sp.]MDU4938789.1 HD domain-containing protein [Clostridium sp.]
MIIKDILYGEFQVEDIFEILINTKEIQRLKKIHQGGASFLVNPKLNITRYDHSIGTMLLIRLLGGSIEEQIAGLFHDISHTAFSHVIDTVLDNKNEDYHEMILKDVINKSDIPKILESNGYNYEDILLNHEKWSILEKSAPKLCADRIDYTLRDMYNNGIITIEDVKKFLSNIKVINDELVITSLETGEWFVETYYKEVIDFFMDPLNIFSNYRFAEVLKLALKKEIITLENFLEDDEYLLTALRSSNDPEIINLLNSISPNIKVIEDSSNYDIHKVNKLRIIDPTIYINNTLNKISNLSSYIRQVNEDAIKKSIKGSYIKIII